LYTHAKLFVSPALFSTS